MFYTHSPYLASSLYHNSLTMTVDDLHGPRFNTKRLHASDMTLLTELHWVSTVTVTIMARPLFVRQTAADCSSLCSPHCSTAVTLTAALHTLESQYEAYIDT